MYVNGCEEPKRKQSETEQGVANACSYQWGSTHKHITSGARQKQGGDWTVEPNLLASFSFFPFFIRPLLTPKHCTGPCARPYNALDHSPRSEAAPPQQEVRGPDDGAAQVACVSCDENEEWSVSIITCPTPSDRSIDRPMEMDREHHLSNPLRSIDRSTDGQDNHAPALASPPPPWYSPDKSLTRNKTPTSACCTIYTHVCC